MKMEEGLEVDWAHIMFNNLSSELDRWTKMQVDGKHETKNKLVIWHQFWKGRSNTCFKKIMGLQKKKKNPKEDKNNQGRNATSYR